MTTATAPAATGIDAVTADQWAVLRTRLVFFGHQSVGDDLMAGVEEVLRDMPDIGLRAVATEDPSLMRGSGLFHARIGQNGAPTTKLEAFESIVSDSDVALTGTAILKFCYVDLVPGVDPEALFAEYRETVEALRAAHPGLTIIHVTAPLMTDAGWLRHRYAGLRGLTSPREGNLVRARYNELLLATYDGREPVFDLARHEATDAAERLHTVRIDGRAVPVLVDAWSSDGAHLNERGRRRIAEAFLVTLAEL